MADENQQGGGLAQTARTAIAKWVIGGATGGLIALAIAMIWMATGDQKGEAAERVFIMLVPLLGTWVGTVLAYYFSGENFDRASESMSKLVERATEERLRGISVKQAMIPRGTMKVVTLPASEDGSSVNLKTELIDKFVDPVTRVPVLDENGVARFIIHQSLVFKFVTKKSLEAVAQGTTFDAATQSLKDFLEYEDMRDVVSSTFVFVPLDGTLADTKKAMEAVNKCQDVFVTDDGSATKPLRGWLTNVDITRHARA